MNRRQRRAAASKDTAFTMEKAVDYILRDTNDINVVVGPTCWRPSDGMAARVWYFVVSTSECGRGWRCDQLVIPPSSDKVAFRAEFLLELVRRKPLVIHDTDDELYAARLCETLWPGERITRIRKTIEAERATDAHKSTASNG